MLNDLKHIHILNVMTQKQKVLLKVCHLKATEMSSSLGAKMNLTKKKKKSLMKFTKLDREDINKKREISSALNKRYVSFIIFNIKTPGMSDPFPKF